MPQDLSEALKEATKEVHTQAENAEFMKNFQKGELTQEGFKVCGLEVPALAGVLWVGVHPKRRAVVLVGMAAWDAEGPDEHVQGSHFTGHDTEAQSGNDLPRVTQQISQPAMWYCGGAGAVVLFK